MELSTLLVLEGGFKFRRLFHKYSVIFLAKNFIFYTWNLHYAVFLQQCRQHTENTNNLKKKYNTYQQTFPKVKKI